MSKGLEAYVKKVRKSYLSELHEFKYVDGSFVQLLSKSVKLAQIWYILVETRPHIRSGTISKRHDQGRHRLCKGP